MGKCVSRQTTTTTCHSIPRDSDSDCDDDAAGGNSLAAHHQSVLTIALSQPDLAQAHKIWQQLTASNEYIVASAQEVATLATTPLAEPPFYYHISRNKALREAEQEEKEQQAGREGRERAEQQAEQPEAKELHAEREWEAVTPPPSPPAALLHIESVYNHLDAHANARHVIAAALTACNSDSAFASASNYATCQEFLLHELLLLQALEEYQVKNITSKGDCQLRENDSDSSEAAQSEEQQEEEQEQQEEQQEQTEQEKEQQYQQPHKGQSESKKHGGGGGSKASRRHNNGNPAPPNPGQLQEHTQLDTLQTKGTAMSFGFRKKLNGTPKKLKKLLHDTTSRDDNGNAAPAVTPTTTPVQFEKVGAAAAKTNPTAAAGGAGGAGVAGAAATGRQGAAGKRFGYRGGQVPRPASAGVENAENNNNNNNANGTGTGTGNAGNNNNNNGNNNSSSNSNVLVSNLKRRSKSAHAGRASDGGEPKIAQPKTLTFNLNQNTTIEYQRRQFFGEIADESLAMTAGTGQRGQVAPPPPRYNYNNLANMHANVIVRPTPRAAPASFAKFTLQTVSLPRPEYPVAISLNATTPTTPSSSSMQSPVPAPAAAHATGARAKEITTKHPLTSIHAQPSSSSSSTGSHRQLDQKSVKQLTNNSTRRGFSGSREISADSGIASMDMAVDSTGSSSSGCGGGGRGSSKSRSRSRPRNLQMVMSGRHTFEVRDMDDPPSSESNSFVETLALPKLPTDNNQTTPLPLVGLVRSNTVLSRESYERRQVAAAGEEQEAGAVVAATPEAPPKPKPSGSDDSESVDEEKLYLDSSTSEKSAKQSLQSCSMSWRCQAGESLAAHDCSSLTNSSSRDGTKQATQQDQEEQEDMSLDDMSLINTELDVPLSSISSLTEPEHLLKLRVADNRQEEKEQQQRPRSFNNALNESKFAELALANSGCLLLEDETSPTDSLVSSTEDSEQAAPAAAGKRQKHKLNAELQQQRLEQDIVDIDDISPVLEELELDPVEGSRSRSPLSPGTPTHASHSLSLGSDCGNLIDDEIADQPGLLCNSEAQELATDTPTLMETHTGTGNGSLRSLKSQSKARTALQQAIELSLRTPAAVRRAVLESAESLDTLSPCESICSDDLMMDFDLNSSIDSISQRSRSGSDLHKMGLELDVTDVAEQAETEAELLSQLECKGSDVMKELNSLLRVRMQRSVASPRERISAKLPARANRLLNRSRLQDQQQQQQLQTGNDSDNSLRSTHSGTSAGRKRSSTAASNASSTSSLQRRQQQQQHQQLSASASGSRRGAGNAELHSSSDDLMLYDKSFRNAMIQDVLQFKKQLLRLRRILQETETLNPFENDNVQLFAACGLDSKQLNDIDLASLTSSTTEDPLQELSDLRRQVVYLQGQVDDRDRTIRLQRDLIEQLEAERRQATGGSTGGSSTGDVANKELISMATQTERTRPLAIGAEGLSRSKPEYTSYTTHFPTLHLHCNDSTLAATTIIRHQQQEPCNGHSSSSNCNNNNNNNNNNSCRALSQTRRHTIISTTLTNYNQQLAAAAYPRRASIAWDGVELGAATPTPVAPAHKPVRITLIGEPLPLPCADNKKTSPTQQQQHHQKQSQQTPQQNGIKPPPPPRFLNGSCNGSSAQGTHSYQPLYNSNKMTNPTVTIV